MKTVKEYRFDTKEMNDNNNELIESLDMFTEDFMCEREQGQNQERKTYDNDNTMFAQWFSLHHWLRF